MSTSPVLIDAALGTAAGYVATKAMEQFSMRAYALEPEADRQQEERVRPGPPFRLAAENLSGRVLGVELDGDAAERAGLVFHYLAGLSWAPVYIGLRRGLGWSPPVAALASGASMSLLLDETVTPAIGASAPNRDYPVSTHIRAAASHLVFGLALGAVTETGWKLLRRRP
jgi:hypothetical protein